jgi:hypothetical protein
MIEKLNHIVLAGETYPIKCDLAVLEAVQEEYGRIGIFEEKLSGLRPTGEKGENGKELYQKGEPSMKAVRFALPLMVNEGIDIENRLEGTDRKHISDEDLKELFSEVNTYEVAALLYLEFCRCFDSKNQRST